MFAGKELLETSRIIVIIILFSRTFTGFILLQCKYRKKESVLYESGESPVVMFLWRFFREKKTLMRMRYVHKIVKDGTCRDITSFQNVVQTVNKVSGVSGC